MSTATNARLVRGDLTLALFVLLPIGAGPAGDDPPDSAGDVPAAFEPLAPLVGRWKGQAVPADNPLRGWREAHEWAWAFEGGEPVGLSLTVEGGTVLSAARLSFDPETSAYRLEGTDPRGEPIVFVGPLDPKTRALTLDRSGPEGEDRVTIRPNANGVRSDFWFDRKAKGAPQFSRLVRANLGKEGASLGPGGGVAAGPQCIVTGGAGTIAVSAGGSTFSVCCSGCRDEVLADPEKYARKLRAVMASSGGGSNAPRTGPGGDAFDAPRTGDPPASDPGPMPPPSPADSPPKPRAEPAEGPAPSPAPAGSDADARRKAASLLRLGQSLEKQGKREGALGFYRRVVEEAPGTPEAGTATDRIKAIEGEVD